MKNTLRILALLLLATLAFGQASHYDQSLNTSTFVTGVKVASPLGGAVVQFCNAPANATPCTNLATVYTDSTATVTASNPITADVNGYFQAWLLPGQYQYTFTYKGQSFGPFSVTASLSNGSPASLQCLNNTCYADQFASLQAAITKACTYSNPHVYLPPNYSTTITGTTAAATESTMLTLCNGLTMDGPGKITIASGTMPTNSGNLDVFYVNNTSLAPLDRITFRDFTVDFNGAHNVQPDSGGKRNAFLFAKYGTNWDISFLTILNQPGNQTMVCGNNTDPPTCSNINVHNNLFIDACDQVPGNTRPQGGNVVYGCTDHSSLYIQATGGSAKNNYFLTTAAASSYTTAIESHSVGFEASGNYVDGWNSCGNIVSSVINSGQYNYHDNTCKHVNIGFQLWTISPYTMDDVSIQGNKIAMNGNPPDNYAAIWTTPATNQVPITKLKIRGNTIYQTGTLNTARWGHGVDLYEATKPDISGNTISNLVGRAIQLGDYVDTAKLSDNTIFDVAQSTVGCGGTCTYQEAIAQTTLTPVNGPILSNNHVFTQNTSFPKYAVNFSGAVNNYKFINNPFNAATGEISSRGSGTGTEVLEYSLKFHFWANPTNVTFRPLIWGGGSAEQLTGICVGNKSALPVVCLNKRADGTVDIDNGSASKYLAFSNLWNIAATGFATLVGSDMGSGGIAHAGALTGATFNTAASGNTFQINGTTVSDKTGTGKAVLDTSPALTTPTFGGGTTLTKYYVVSGAITPAQTNANTCAEQTFTPAAFSGVVNSGDNVFLNSSATMAGNGVFPVTGIRAVANGVAITYCNSTAGNLTAPAVTITVTGTR